MIKKFDFENKRRLSLKVKIIIFLAVLLGIIIGLDYFFDNYTFVSPIKKLEFQWVIQRRSNIKIDKKIGSKNNFLKVYNLA